MNTLILQPSDLLFFRDGRPMGGSLSGHGAAWPLPTVVNGAIRAALWRTETLAIAARPHHRKSPSGAQGPEERFGSLVTVGPFPVLGNGGAETWYFPRPLDATVTTESPLFAPSLPVLGSSSSCPLPLAVGSKVPPSKDTLEDWWSASQWSRYAGLAGKPTSSEVPLGVRDSCIADAEATIGIGISSETGTQDGERLFSAHYLRLRQGWKLGMLASTSDKNDTFGDRTDHVSQLFPEDGVLLVGGQLRSCTVRKTAAGPGRPLPLPLGQTVGFPSARLHLDPTSDEPLHLVKWTLLTPAIFPSIPASTPPTPGGWLPSWIHPESHEVQLRAPLEARKTTESRDSYRARLQAQPFIGARLVAALVGKAIPVAGWAPGSGDSKEVADGGLGPKHFHLAVPAGSVFYFAARTASDAQALAQALNWHGNSTGTAVRNRRSTLMGEKGFGLGLCTGWTPIGARTSAEVHTISSSS